MATQGDGLKKQRVEFERYCDKWVSRLIGWKIMEISTVCRLIGWKIMEISTVVKF